MRTARYLSELTKFRCAPPIVTLNCLALCNEDFTGYNVEIACCILESCGRFLYRTKHTNPRITAMMETMTRLSKAKVRFINPHKWLSLYYMYI
jgi:regulator of nonsense transcripts 2